MNILLDHSNKPAKNFSFIAKSNMAAGGQRSKIDQIWPHKSHFGSAFGPRSSDLDKIWHEHTSWSYKQLCSKVYQLVQNPRWPPEVKGPKSTKLDLTSHIFARHLDLVRQIWTKFDMNILLDHMIQTSLRKNLLVRSKSKMNAGGQRSKIDQIWLHNSFFYYFFGAKFY